MLQRAPGRWGTQPATGASAGSDGSTAQLAERIRCGDARAEAEFVERFYSRVLVMLVGRTRDRDAARDLAQQVMMDVLSAVRAGRVEEPGKLVAFLHGVARNVANDYFRNRFRRLRDVPIDDAMGTPEASDAGETRRLGKVVRRALQGLDRVDRHILHMFFALEMSAVEIGYALGMEADAVRQRKRRALCRLRIACHAGQGSRDVIVEAHDE